MAGGAKTPLLNMQHYDILNQVLAECGRLAAILEKLKAAGVGNDQLEIHNQQTGQIASGMKKQFFPDHP
jgi:hypothetical protein